MEDNVNWFHGKISRDTAEKLLKEGLYKTSHLLCCFHEVSDLCTYHVLVVFRG